MAQFAVIETGGKQLRVETNQLFDIERVKGAETTKELILDKVLLVNTGKTVEVGFPYVKGASVICEFLGENRGPKVITFKMRRRKNYRRKTGHRQWLSRVRVKEIQFQG